MKVLILGNGSAGIDDKQNIFINNHTGNFLLNLKKKFEKIAYCGFTTQYNKDSNLLNFNLKGSSVDFIPVRRKSRFILVTQITKLFYTQLWHHDFLYIFFPGSLGRIIAILALLTGKNIGFYVRGELFGNSWIDKIILKRSRFVLTISPSIQNRLLKVNKQVEVIRPMISITSTDIKERVLISKEDYNLLFVGRIERRKGILELIKAYEILKQEQVKATLTLVGGGDLLEELLLKQSQGVIDKEIIFTGLISERNELISYYQKADIFVFPSHDEGFPRVLYDAMAQSLPILTTLVGGIPGYMKPGYNCVALPLKDENGQARVIQEAINKYYSLQTLVDNGRATIKRILTKKSHEQLFEEFVNSDINE